MLKVIKTFEFCAGHFLPGYPGICKKNHGHNFKLEVGVCCKQLDELGMILDFSILKTMVNEVVIDKLDHEWLNGVEGLEQPTCENMVLWIVDLLEQKIDKSKIKGILSPILDLCLVRLWETSTSYCEWSTD